MPKAERPRGQETAITFESPQRLIKQIAWPDPGFHSIVLKELAPLNRRAMADIHRKMILQGIPDFYSSAHAHDPFIPGKSRIPYGGRIFDEKEITAAVDASLDFWLTAGRYAETFEKRFAQQTILLICCLTDNEFFYIDIVPYRKQTH